MKLLKTEQFLWERKCTKSVLLEIKLNPRPQKVMEVVPSVVALRQKRQESSIVVIADLCVEVYFSDKSSSVNFLQHEKRITEVFLPEKVAEGMQVYVSCHVRIRDMNLTGDILTVTLELDFKLEGVTERQAAANIPPEAIVTQKITAYQSCRAKTWMGSTYGIFQKSDLRHILAIKPHGEQVEVKLFSGIAVVEGDIVLDIFYRDVEGIEKYDRLHVPLRETVECEAAAPQRLAKVKLVFSGVRHSIKNCGEWEIIVAYKLEVKVLEKKERDIIVEINAPGYETLKKELVLNQNVCQGTITLMLEEDFILPYFVKDVVDVYGRVEDLTYLPMEGGFTAEGTLGIELYFVCSQQRERCKYLEMKFRKAQLIDGVTGEEEYELAGRILHISADPLSQGIKVKALLEIDYTGMVRQQLEAITEVIPGEGVQKELFRVERCLEQRHIDFVEKFEISTDSPIDRLESVKGEIENVEITVMDSKVLIQCNISVHVYYAGTDGLLHSKTALFPFGIFEDIKEGSSKMQVRLRPQILEVKTELVALQKLNTILNLGFDLLATLEEDIYLVTDVPKEQVKIRQVLYEDHKFNVAFLLPLTSPVLKVKTLEVEPQKIWLKKDSSGRWAVGELAISCSYVGRDHLLYQDFERLDFRFKIPDADEIDQNNIEVCARASKIMSNPDNEMAEVDLEVKLRTFHFASIY